MQQQVDRQRVQLYLTLDPSALVLLEGQHSPGGRIRPRAYQGLAKHRIQQRASAALQDRPDKIEGIAQAATRPLIGPKDQPLQACRFWETLKSEPDVKFGKLENHSAI